MRLFAAQIRINWRLVALTAILPFYSVPIFSQVDKVFDSKIDSLKALLNISTGAVRQDVLFNLGYEYLQVEDSLGLPYSSEAFEMSWQFGDSLKIVKSGRAKAMILKELEQYDSLIALSSKILPIAKRNSYTKEIKYLVSLLGIAHTYKAEYDKALAYDLESLELRKNGDALSISIALNNLGLVYYKIKDYNRALSYFERVRELRNDIIPSVDKSYYLSSLLNISLCHLYMNNLEQAEGFIKQVIRSCQTGCSDDVMMGVHFSSGLLNFNRRNLRTAAKEFSTSLSMARKIPSKRYQLDNLIYLAEVEIKLKRLHKAEDYLLEADKLFATVSPFSLELIQIYRELFQLYSKLGNYPKVAFYQNKYIQLKDSTFNERLTINLMKVEAEYLEREHLAKTEGQKKILALNNDVISRQRILNIIVGAVAVLLVALVVVLIQNVSQKKAANYLLEQKVKERTLDLECKHDLLVKLMQERDLEVQRMTNEIKASLSTIKGLGLLVLHDVNMINATTYVSKIEQTSNNLLEGLNLGRTSGSD